MNRFRAGLVRTFMSLLLPLAALGLACPDATAQDRTLKLRLHHWNSPMGGAHRKFLTPWAERVNAKAGGHVVWEVYPSMQLGGRPADLYAQARDGVVDAIWTIPGYTPGRFPRSEVFNLPFVTGKAEVTSPAAFELWQSTDWLKDEYGDTVPLMFHTSPTEALYSTRAINRIEDLRGLKIRVSEQLQGEAVERLGAVIIGMPITEVVPSLQRKVIDGLTTSWAIGRIFKICDVAHHHVNLPGFSNTLFVLTMNRGSWGKLSADMQKIVRDESNIALAKELGRIWDQDDQGGRDYCAKSGATVSLDPAALNRWKSAMRPVVDDWIAKTRSKGFDGGALVADLERLLKKHM